MGGSADLLVSGRVTEAHRIFLRVGQRINPARMDLGSVGTREQGHDRERLAGIDRAEDDADILPMRQLRCSIDRLCRVALGVASNQFDLPPIYPAGRVDLLHRQLGSAIDPDTSGGRRTSPPCELTDATRRVWVCAAP